MSFLQIFGLVVVAVLLVSLVSHWVVISRERKRWSQVMGSWRRTSFTPAEVQSDIDYYQDLYLRVHPAPFHAMDQVQFNQLFAALKQSVEQDLSRTDVFCLLADAVSRFNDEHTQVSMPSVELNQLLGEKDEVFPLEVFLQEDRCFVRSAKAGRDLLPIGAEILSINRIPVPEIIAKLSRLFWGTSDKQRTTYAQKYFTEALYLAYGFEDWFDLSVRLPDGRQQERRVTGVEYIVHPRPPFACTIQDEIMLFEYLEFEDPERNFNQFLKSMFTEMQQKSIRTLVIDLRANQGGTSSYGDVMLRHLTDKPFSQFDQVEIRSSPEVKSFFLSYLPAAMHWLLPLPYLHPLLRSLWRTRNGEISSIHFQPVKPAPDVTPFEGNVYVLVGPGTMSSASLLAAAVKHYGLGQLIGAETGGYPTHYGNMLDLYLPVTGLRVRIPSSINHGNGTGPVIPHIHLEQDLEDLKSGQDTVLQYVRQAASSGVHPEHH